MEHFGQLCPTGNGQTKNLDFDQHFCLVVWLKLINVSGCRLKKTKILYSTQSALKIIHFFGPRIWLSTKFEALRICSHPPVWHKKQDFLNFLNTTTLFSACMPLRNLSHHHSYAFSDLLTGVNILVKISKLFPQG